MKGMLLICSILVSSNLGAKHMKLVHSWNEMDYSFPSDSIRQAKLQNGSFIPGHSVPISMSVDLQDGKVFVSMPRIKPGNPATLALVSKTKKNKLGQPLLEPYPNWDWHNEGNCNGITSVYRTHIDECRNLWILDTGSIGGSTDQAVGVNRICPAQLLIFDVVTNKLIGRYQFPRNLILPQSVLTTIAVDVMDTARKCVIALALTPKRDNQEQERTLYFHSLAGVKESWISTHLLRNKSNFPASGNLVARQIHVSIGERKSQATTQMFDKNGVLFFSDLRNTSINCWNSRTTYQQDNIHE